MTTPESKAAKLLGRKGGRSKSEAKVQASRDNGKLGGRPTRDPKLHYWLPRWADAYECMKCGKRVQGSTRQFAEVQHEACPEEG